MTSSKDSEFFYFRSEFDKTLRMYFKEVIDLSLLPENLNLNIPVLSCLILLVEREREIQDFPQSPPERYTKESFIEDIENVGIGVDKIILNTVDSLISMGFIFESEKEIKPSETTFKVVNFLNGLFPGMPGINFIAYLVQTIDEVHSDRKSIAQGKEVFYQTLKSRSAKKKSAQQRSLKIDAPRKEKAGVNSKALKERLSKLRRERRSSDDVFMKKTEVKSVFKTFEEKEPEVEEEVVEPEEDQKSETIETEVEKEESPKETKGKDKEPAKEEIDEIEEPEPELKPEPEPEPELKPEPEEKEPVKEEAKVEKEPEPKVEKEEPSEKAVEEVLEEQVVSEEDIEKRISQFQQQLAMTCPVCNEGKIVDSITEKGKDFYQCSNDLCHFISWAKPFHFPCPVCKNPFLVETIFPGGVKGLQCPRATCDFKQDDQKNPETKAKPKKKKKVVRRVRRKK